MFSNEEGTCATVADGAPAVRPSDCPAAALVASARLSFALLADAPPGSERCRLLRRTFTHTVSLLIVEFPAALEVSPAPNESGDAVALAFPDGLRVSVPLHVLDRS